MTVSLHAAHSGELKPARGIKHSSALGCSRLAAADQLRITQGQRRPESNSRQRCGQFDCTGPLSTADALTVVQFAAFFNAVNLALTRAFLPGGER